AVTHGSRAGSNRKLTWPRAHTTPAAQVARRPPGSGEGRLRASFATARRARSAYSSSMMAEHRVGDADDLISHRPQPFRNLQLVQLNHGTPRHSLLTTGVRGSVPCGTVRRRPGPA